MRLISCLALLGCLSLPVQASEPLSPHVLELTGVGLLCEQSAPLLARGMSDAQQRQLDALFAAGPLCEELAQDVAQQVSEADLRQALQLLDSDLVRHFTAAERAVASDGGLVAYRRQLQERAPLPARLELVRRLDRAAHTSELATQLRYEVGKTQALLVLREQGERLDEPQLNARTTDQFEALRSSSTAGVESFMLYAYRRTPSAQLEEYATLYEQPALRTVLQASTAALPRVFAKRRAQLQ